MIQLFSRKDDTDHAQAVVSLIDDDGPACARVELDSLMRHAAPVSVVVAGKHAAIEVDRGFNSLGHHRACTVCADDDASVFGDCCAVRVASANAGDRLAIRCQLFDCKSFTQFSADFDSRVDQNLVEYPASRCVSIGDSVSRHWRAGECERSDIEFDLPRWWTV